MHRQLRHKNVYLLHKAPQNAQYYEVRGATHKTWSTVVDASGSSVVHLLEHDRYFLEEPAAPQTDGVWIVFMEAAPSQMLIQLWLCRPSARPQNLQWWRLNCLNESGLHTNADGFFILMRWLCRRVFATTYEPNYWKWFLFQTVEWIPDNVLLILRSLDGHV